MIGPAGATTGCRDPGEGVIDDSLRRLAQVDASASHPPARDDVTSSSSNPCASSSSAAAVIELKGSCAVGDVEQAVLAVGEVEHPEHGELQVWRAPHRLPGTSAPAELRFPERLYVDHSPVGVDDGEDRFQRL